MYCLVVIRLNINMKIELNNDCPFTYEKLCELLIPEVESMRNFQKAYFKHPDKTWLKDAKEKEAKVDEILRIFRLYKK